MKSLKNIIVVLTALMTLMVRADIMETPLFTPKGKPFEVVVHHQGVAAITIFTVVKGGEKEDMKTLKKEVFYGKTPLIRVHEGKNIREGLQPGVMIDFVSKTKKEGETTTLLSKKEMRELEKESKMIFKKIPR